MKKVALGTVVVLLLLAMLAGCGRDKEADITPPAISAVAVSGITTSGASITWTTNESATSQVEYGQTTGYGSTSTLDTNLVTSHSVSLSGLESNTVYHYRVLSEDGSENEAQSGDLTLTTLGDDGAVIGYAMKFKTFSYVDANGIGIEAFRMFIPSDWTFDGGIEWKFDNPGAPAVASFWVQEPNGKAELELLPAQSFFSTQDPSILQYFSFGSKYYGNEVRPYPSLGASETLKQIIVPRFRNNVTNLKIVSEQSLPEIAALLRAGIATQPNTTTEAAKIRIEYEQNGKAMEEEIYCVVEATSFQTVIYNNTLWMADYLFSFKAEKGELDTQYKLFQTMMYSFRLNPQWFNKYVQLIDYLVQNELTEIQSQGQLSEIISQTSDEISDMVMQSYNNRNAANDRMAEDFSNYISGTESYFNPLDEDIVELPSGYSDAWANNLGEYILSDNVNYNPNIGSSQSWQRMEIR